MPNEDDDLYSQRDMPADKSSKDDSGDDDMDDQKTALLPKSILGGHKCKVGDIKKFRVVAIYDDEYEVEYVRGDKDKDDDSNETRDESERELDSMVTE